nr:immunoglobulin heavy chain junction region [Macaca mulatta]MOV90856.1 immunoglobulin heavy chain junction region [Macaca mulatta]
CARESRVASAINLDYW